MNRGRDIDFDYLDLDDDSDPERAESSDDDIDILLHGTPEQKRKLCKLGATRSDSRSSSEDEFEKEMNKELNGTVKAIEKRRGSVTEPGCSSSSHSDNPGDSTEPEKHYDDVYFDSDEEEMVTKGDAKAKRKQMTNDDLLYDPDIDEDNEKWMANQRRSHLPKASGDKEKKVKPLPHSDAVLDCPACMTTLCLDCQRHDVYNDQYRAMFVMNCAVDRSEVRKYPKAGKNAGKRKKTKASASKDTSDVNAAADDLFHAVKCTECNTVVAVYDDDEIYHFFNVLASY